MKKNEKLDIIYEDKDIIVVNKPAGLLTISTDKEKEKTLFHKVYVYIKKKNKNNKIFIVHRLDKDTSGIVMFAKSESLKVKFQNDWDNLAIERKYVAIVHGVVKDKKREIVSWLKETKTLLTYSSNKKEGGKKAITEYRVVGNNDNYSLLDIDIKTGRKNQIRVHMKDIEHPIVGDNKYGLNDKFKRMYLHAYKLSIIHPVTKKIFAFETDIPTNFIKLIQK
ncbi:MAG: RNA pseudouridine synthase [Bacilli bacterium]|nr:RNA pseudouridine synthase [Bacilli bacterium]